MKNPIEYLDRFGFDRDDKITVAKFFVCFGIVWMFIMLFMNNNVVLVTMGFIASVVVVMGNHYYRKYKRDKDPLLALPPK